MPIFHDINKKSFILELKSKLLEINKINDQD